MPEIPSHDLRNQLSAVLRRVQEGEELTVTTDGRPVARLLPLANRPTSIPTRTLLTVLEKASADRELAGHLTEQLAQTTYDLM